MVTNCIQRKRQALSLMLANIIVVAITLIVAIRFFRKYRN